MRKLLWVVLPFVTVALQAQEVRVEQRNIRFSGPPSWFKPLQESEQRVAFLSAAVKRDAFIVAQLVKASGALEDYQVNAAIQRALDRAEAARKRSAEAPQASSQTMTAISKVSDALEQARQQGMAADLPATKKLIMAQTHFVQVELFAELDVVRRERQFLGDALNRLNQMNLQLDAAMLEALGSTFDFVKAGGE